jgi:aminoglycoside/choline kinase family phosphotransferase
MIGRAALIESFLARAGWGDAIRLPLAGDASFRHYERLRRNGSTAVLMDAPPPKEDVRPFIHIAQHLAGLGYSAPRIDAADESGGLILLEDLGDDLYTRLLSPAADPPREVEMYGAAIDLLADLHLKPVPSGLARYDEAKLLADAELFLDWYVPRRLGRDASPTERDDFRTAWRVVLPRGSVVPAALALRDYHADNLMWLPPRIGARDDPHGIRRVGLLDFQDALLAPLPYDIVSLLEDARRDVPPALAEAMVERYLAARPGLERDAFLASYAVMGAQRNVRILGVFARLSKRDGKHRYLDYLPRLWRLVERDLAHPALRPVAAWLDAVVPPALRERAA